MPVCLSSSKIARIRAEIATKEEQLAKANETFLKMLGESVESYRFDSNEGAQSARSRKLEELKKIIDSLESSLDSLYRRLSCKGVMMLNLRRKRLEILNGYGVL